MMIFQAFKAGVKSVILEPFLCSFFSVTTKDTELKILGQLDPTLVHTLTQGFEN